MIFLTTFGGRVLMYNNVFINALSAGQGSIYAQDGVTAASGTTPVDYHIYNNTFVDARNMVFLRTLAATTPVVGGGAGGAVYIKNNIFYKTDNGPAYGIETGQDGSLGALSNPTEMDYNIYVTGRSDNVVASMMSGTTRTLRTLTQIKAAGYEAHGLQVDPKFVAFTGLGANSTSNNVRLQTTSPAIGKALPLDSVFTKDRNNVTRGSRWDIGAVEYDGVPINVNVQIQTSP
jgi:hypothetical protein